MPNKPELQTETSRQDKGNLMVANDVLAASDGVALAVAESTILGVAQEIRTMHRLHGLRFVVGVGRVIVERFFGGDASAIHKRGPKDDSLKRLAEQPDMPLSLPQLSRAVAIFEAVEPLGEVDTWQHLSMSHVRAVLPLPAPDQQALLTKTEKKGWSVKMLEAQARKKKRKRGGGRHPLPRFVKSIRALGKFDDDDLFGDLDGIDSLEPEDADALYKTVTGLKLRCEKLQEQLQPRVSGFGRRK